jgi:hypothetical protein
MTTIQKSEDIRGVVTTQGGACSNKLHGNATSTGKSQAEWTFGGKVSGENSESEISAPLGKVGSPPGQRITGVVLHSLGGIAPK